MTGCCGNAIAQNHKKVSIPHSTSPGQEPKSAFEVWLLLIGYHFYTIIKSKNSKSNHPNLGIIYVCVLVCMCVCVRVWSHGTEINFVLSMIVYSPLLLYKTNLNFYLFSLYKYCIIFCIYSNRWDFPGGFSGKEPACQCRTHKKHKFDPWVRKIPWRRK